MELEKLKEEIRRRYPIGCTIKCLDNEEDETIITAHNFEDEDSPNFYWTFMSNYDNGDYEDVEIHTMNSYFHIVRDADDEEDITWAEIVSTDTSIQLYPLIS